MSALSPDERRALETGLRTQTVIVEFLIDIARRDRFPPELLAVLADAAQASWVAAKALATPSGRCPSAPLASNSEELRG
jgi:hypothetical protein